LAKDERQLQAATEQSAALLAAAGFPRMPARVLMRLMANDTGMTAAELAAELAASAAAISGAVRYLQQVGIIRRIATGTRRDRYELPGDAWYTMVTGRSPLYGALAGLAEAAALATGDTSSPAAERLDEMARFYRFIDARLPAVMDEWEEERKRQR